MGFFERCRRDLRRALCLTALAIPLGALSQPVPCSRLPEAKQAEARESGFCVDDSATTAAKKTRVLTPEGAARAAAAAGTTAAATTAASVKGAPPRFQCAKLPDFVANRATYEQAVQELPPGLYLPRIAKFSPSSAPARVVLAQSTGPLDGKLCSVTFVLSDGSLVRVPPLRGLTREVAAQRLQAAGLRMAAREQPSDAAAAGRIFEQRPAADADAARGSVVQVAVALPTTIAVPNVVGSNLGDVKPSLARFIVSTRQRESVRPAGEIVAQLPPGDTRAGPGSELVLTLSDGSLVEVPELVKRQIAKAKELLDQIGLRVSTVEDKAGAPVGMVTTQQPSFGTAVKRGSVVTLHVSAGLDVPGVVGRQLADAQAALRSFVVHEERVASDRAEGEVLEQSPPAGTRAAARSRVTLSVSDGSIVTVPPLHGATLADARAALQRAGDLNAMTPNGDEPGTMLVDTSSPVAGLRVRRGSTVALTLVPVTPWRAWAAGIATLLVLGGAGLYKWRRRKVVVPASPTPPALPTVDAHFSPSMEFNIRPIEAHAGGPEVPAIGLHAELVPGRAWARQTGEST